MRDRLILPGLMLLTTAIGCFGAATAGRDDERPVATNDDRMPGPAPGGECDGGGSMTEMAERAP